MEEADHHFDFSSGSLHLASTHPPPLVSLSPFSPIPSPSSRRLSTHFTPSCSVTSARRLARVSLQGRILNAEEASSAKAIGGDLSREQIVAWELFSPIQRFLIVAVIRVAVAKSKKNKLISQLKKSVALRDQVLSSMQQKLDDLCEQVSSIKNNAVSEANASLNNNVESPSVDAFGCDTIKFIDCSCWHCDRHQNLFAGLMGNYAMKLCKEHEVLQYKIPSINEVEQEERRMSDLSDWASSVTSTADIQMNRCTIDQDIFNLKRECDEKDATIKELVTTLQSTENARSKKTAALEDSIRRKNTMIMKLKKDMIVLEQKVVHLTRLHRTSSAPPNLSSKEVPLLLDNIVYDMDSSTSPSSSDSDSSPLNWAQASLTKNQDMPLKSKDLAPTRKQTSASAKNMNSLARLNERQTKSRPGSPLKEIPTNQKPSKLSSLRQKELSASGEFKKIRRQTQTSSTDAAPKKRWV
ncbi:uncharacterized protein LOC110631200 [Manihot esculenta]|uniref:Uncharacterized protein n=1 Tax=Manihot esculenta TaxID=3983 RepID=A0A251J8E8_MANES|nr:uncharacterized protein LOC110631200 [Manihot esculenta]OAY30210.1 hypothetical protein MANES_14G013400v8 [Manihot esculenta]OAY30211.1 hypothetical protein MANES_14G013400v8 [Manihot esculenta]